MTWTVEQYCDLLGDRLLGDRLNDDRAREMLAPAGFADWRAAWRCLQRMAGNPSLQAALADLLPHLLVTLSGAANPDHVLVNLERLALSAPDSLALFYFLASHPRAVEILMTLFAGSQFLTEILLRDSRYFARLTEPKRLAKLESVEQLAVAAQAAISSSELVAGQLDALRRFQRWEFLRIGTCDLLGLFDLTTATAQLANLADSLVQACLTIASAQTQTPADHFCVIGMGKLGGQELNYSSDIDLLFLAALDAPRYRRLGEKLIEALTLMTAEGFLYRVDMRLRPWGQVGALVTSVDGYLAYLGQHARLWEKQALLKARVIAGSGAVGRDFLHRVEPFLFESLSPAVRADVHAMKQQTETHLRRQGRGWGQVKLGEGSIRDVEFTAQTLQLAQGARRPDIRSLNTLDALTRLAAAGLLSADDHRVLADGYVFLRTIEHHLQMMHYCQTHTLPAEPEALGHLARRLGFEGPDAGEQFLARYQQHGLAIRAVYGRHVGSEAMDTSTDPHSVPTAPAIREHVARMDPSYTTTFTAHEIQRHAALAEHLDDGHLAEVQAMLLDDGRWRVTVVAFDYLGELSLICGLFFVYGLSIYDANVFTYEPLAEPSAAAREYTRRKIVDVFTVRPERGEIPADIWTRYASDLTALLRWMDAGERRAARGALVKRVAASLPEAAGSSAALYPIDVEIDNDASDRYTVLRIAAPDTLGFLYEFTNGLAINRVHIARMSADSAGHRVHDTLWVTDAQGAKITAPGKQRELRAATVLIKHFTHLLPLSPNPESALLHFRELLGELFRRPNWPDELASLEQPKVLNALARLLGVSEFLWDDFLRMQYNNLFPVVRDVDALAAAKAQAQVRAELEAALQAACSGLAEGSRGQAWRGALNAYKDREMFRVDMRHILGHTREFWEFSAELGDLAEVIVEATYHFCEQELLAQYGVPCLADGQPCPLTVCALGKCGGRELGFASDIELMFIYAGNGKTRGPHIITTAEFYEKLVQTFVAAIRAKREGVFEIDLQLRPYGKAGSMAVSLDAFRRYFAPDGPAWAYERQALVKLRPIAGDPALGRKIVELRDAFAYNGEHFDATAMRAMRERQIRHLVTGGTFNAKFSPGGLVDVEYLVQGLQITHGHDQPGLRLTNTREAMAKLADLGILTPEDYVCLRKAHTFLCWLIDSLRVVRGNTKDMTVPPADSQEFEFLARRLRYGQNLARLRDELTSYTSSVQDLSARLLRQGPFGEQKHG